MYGKKGSNGKSKFAVALVCVLGGVAAQCRPDILLPPKAGGTCTPFEMELKDKVLAVISEPQKSQVYSGATLKDISGGDLKTGAKKYEHAETFEQTAKPLILCNAIITVDECDPALLSRTYITGTPGRFEHTANPDPAIQNRDAIYPVIEDFWNDRRKRALLNLIVFKGLNGYMKEGLLKTEKQQKELAEWQANSDMYCSFGRDFEANHAGFEYMTSARSLWEKFRKKNGKQVGGNVGYDEFIREMGGRGWKVIKEPDGDWFPYFHLDCDDRKQAKTGPDSDINGCLLRAPVMKEPVASSPDVKYYQFPKEDEDEYEERRIIPPPTASMTISADR
jgi:phage/plasmid-associated DNA primase